MNSDKIKNRLQNSLSPLRRTSKRIVFGIGMATLASSGTASAAGNQPAENLIDPKIVIERRTLSKLSGKFMLKRINFVNKRFAHASHSSHSSHSSHYSSSGGDYGSSYPSSSSTPQYGYGTQPPAYVTPTPAAPQTTVPNSNGNLKANPNSPINLTATPIQIVSNAEIPHSGFDWGWFGWLGLLGLFGLLPRKNKIEKQNFSRTYSNRNVPPNKRENR